MPKDKIVKTSKHGEGSSRVKSIKDIGGGVKTQLIKNPDKSTITQRYEDNKLVASNYNPKKMKVKKMRKRRVVKSKPIKAGPTPNYTSKLNFSDEEQKIMDKQERINKYNKKNKKKRKVKRPRARRTKNLVTGKTNITK
jgi:hypothetical protein